MNSAINESLEKEFELERIILFSDAVFAIAITLLILEIKFPAFPKDLKGVNVFKLIWPTILHFFAFTVSFFFIGQSWARHLTLCKFLKQYNNKVIFYNLLLLFFIVTFPFSISAFMDNIRSAFFIAIFVYISNIFFVTTAQFLFTHYIIKANTALTVEGRNDEKFYFYLKSKYGFIMMAVMLLIMIFASIISNNNPIAVGASLYALPVFSIIMTRKLKKYKPKNSNNNY